MSRFSIHNALVVTGWETGLTRGGVLVRDGVVEAVGPVAAEPGSIDARGALVLPGMVNAHTHLYSALACGMPGPAVPPASFVEILERIWWRLDRALDPELVRHSAIVGALEAARSGVCALIDHHASPNAIDGSLGIIADALERVGVSGALCYEVTDRGGQPQRDAGVRENVRSGQLIGAHASFTVSDATLEALGRAVRETGRGLHVHVAEDGADLEPGDPIARYEAHGLLGPGSILAHGVHLSAGPLARAAEHGCWLVHNARSNMNNHVGYAQLAAEGYPKLALGTDGIGCDMFAEARAAFLKARDAGVPDAWGLPLRLLQGSFALAEQLFGRPFGRIEPGASADLILTDYVPPTPVNDQNLLGHLLFGFDRSHVSRVWAGGAPIWPTPLDTSAIYRESREAAVELWRRMETLDG